MIYAYFNGAYIYGLTIFFLHDICENFLNLSRFFREIKGLFGEIMTVFMAINLLIFWFYFRVYGFYTEITKNMYIVLKKHYE